MLARASCVRRAEFMLLFRMQDAGTKDALQFLMTREMHPLKAFTAALESMKKPAFSSGKLAPTPGLVNQFSTTPPEQATKVRSTHADHGMKAASRNLWPPRPSADVHQEILAVRIFAIQTLNGILHCRGEFAVGTSELFEEHIAKTRIRLVDANGVHKFFDVMIHDDLYG